MTGHLKVVIVCLALLLCSAAGVSAGSVAAAEEAGQQGIVVTEELLRKGRALFIGEEHFAKRAAPCVACHALRYPGVRGGNWGPDLTEMYTNLSEEGLMAVLQSPPYAGMQKMYEERPLTEDEIKALVAFAKDAAAGREDAAPHFFPWAGIGFFGLILGIFSLYKRRIR